MSPDISERSFEEAIEQALLEGGPDAPPRTGPMAAREEPLPSGAHLPGGYHRRRPEDYDRALCLLPRDVVDFVLATQPREWQRLKAHYGHEVECRFLRRLSSEIESRGALDVLRQGIKDSGCRFRLAFFRPASGLNKEIQRLYRANIFSVVRQLRYSDQHEKSLDLVLFLNGIPIFTAELKNPLTGQTVEDAIHQYKTDRDPREPLFRYGRCLAHTRRALQNRRLLLPAHPPRKRSRLISQLAAEYQCSIPDQRGLPWRHPPAHSFNGQGESRTASGLPSASPILAIPTTQRQFAAPSSPRFAPLVP